MIFLFNTEKSLHVTDVKDITKMLCKSACLVFNPIMDNNYAAFFNCMPVGRASDSMMAPT